MRPNAPVGTHVVTVLHQLHNPPVQPPEDEFSSRPNWVWALSGSLGSSRWPLGVFRRPPTRRASRIQSACFFHRSPELSPVEHQLATSFARSLIGWFACRPRVIHDSRFPIRHLQSPIHSHSHLPSWAQYFVTPILSIRLDQFHRHSAHICVRQLRRLLICSSGSSSSVSGRILTLLSPSRPRARGATSATPTQQSRWMSERASESAKGATESRRRSWPFAARVSRLDSCSCFHSYGFAIYFRLVAAAYVNGSRAAPSVETLGACARGTILVVMGRAGKVSCVLCRVVGKLGFLSEQSVEFRSLDETVPNSKIFHK